MKRKLVSISTIFLISFLVGCSGKEVKVPLEDVGLVGIMAFDYIDEDTTDLTVAIPQYSPEAQKKTQVFSVHTDLVSKGIVKIEAQSDKKIILNQLRVVLLSEEYAKNGKVDKVIQHLYRSAEVGNKVLIAIVKGSAKEIVSAEYPDKPNIIFYLNDLLQPSINTAFNPNTDVHDLVYTITNPVIDPIIPLLEGKDGKVEIVGVALFKEKHMYKTITPNEALIIQALQGKKKLAPLALDLHQSHKKESLLLDLIKSKVKIKSNKNIEAPKLTISLKIEGTLSEYEGEREFQLKTPKQITSLEKDINEQIEKDIKQFLVKLKEFEVDPIGLSEYFRMYYKGDWTKEMTKDIIRKLEVDIQANTFIISTGTLE